MKNEMICVVLRRAGELCVEERPIPRCPDDGLLLKVLACGICGSDVRNYANGLRDGFENQIIGHEIAGEVIEVSPMVTRFRVGDRVALAPDVSCGECYYCKHGLVNLCNSHRMLGTNFPGGFAQYIGIESVVLQNGFVEAVSHGMSPYHAAFAETLSAVLACHARINISLGDRIVVIGDGPVGCLHADVARARGAGKVIIVGMDRLPLAKRFAPDALLDNRDTNHVQQVVMDLTDGLGADFVICAVPSVKPQQQALELCRKRGTVVIYGGVPKDADTTAINSNLIHYRELTVTGAFSYPASGLYNALKAIDDGKIDPDAYITNVLPLQQAVDGIEMLRQGQALKVILDPWMLEKTT